MILMYSEQSRKRAINAWVMYDWANSAFFTTIQAAVLPTFFASVAAATLSQVEATSYWAIANTIALLVIALVAPIVGAIADFGGAKKKFLAAFLIPGILATGALVLVGYGQWKLASGLYIVGLIGVSGSMIFYDSLLPHITRPDEMDQISARGFAIGYLGGGLLLAINIAWIMAPDLFGITALGNRFGVDGTEMASRLSFLSVAIWWAVFSIPLFRHIKEPPRPIDASLTHSNPVKGGFTRLKQTFRELRLYRQALIFLVAFWIYNDGIGTIMKMAVIYGDEIGIGQIDLIGALLLTQFVGIPCALIFGRLPNRDEPRQALFLSLLVYNAITIPLIGVLAPRLGITSGPIAVGLVLANQIPAFLISYFLGQRVLGGIAQRIRVKHAIMLGLVVYAIASVWGYFMATAVEFWLLAVMIGLVQGGAQALSRSLFGNMVPKARSAEFFGFYDMSSKFAGIVGPLLFAVVGRATGSSRGGIFSLVIFFVVGAILLNRVDEDEGRRVARAADAQASALPG
jgi:MFS transporter, UMF1 family